MLTILLAAILLHSPDPSLTNKQWTRAVRVCQKRHWKGELSIPITTMADVWDPETGRYDRTPEPNTYDLSCAIVKEWLAHPPPSLEEWNKQCGAKQQEELKKTGHITSNCTVIA